MKENIVIITGHGEYPQGVKSFIREVAGELKNIYYKQKSWIYFYLTYLFLCFI